MPPATRPEHVPARRVAVAIPVRDEEERLPACLAALDRAAADHPAFVAAQRRFATASLGSTDGTAPARAAEAISRVLASG